MDLQSASTRALNITKCLTFAVLWIRIRDPAAFLTPGSGIWDDKKIWDLDLGKTSQIIFLRAQKQFLGLKILKFFDADPNPGSGIFLTLDPGWKN